MENISPTFGEDKSMRTFAEPLRAKEKLLETLSEPFKDNDTLKK
jgi:hypothetical protein